MLATPHDAVTQFLTSQGVSPQVAYFKDSDFVLGWEVVLDELELIYRLDDTQLTVCHFAARDGLAGSKPAVLRFIRLIHQIQQQVPQVHSVRGMLMETLAQPELNEVRRRLAHALEAQGARWEDIDGDPWLVYPMH